MPNKIRLDFQGECQTDDGTIYPAGWTISSGWIAGPSSKPVSKQQAIDNLEAFIAEAFDVLAALKSAPPELHLSPTGRQYQQVWPAGER